MTFCHVRMESCGSIAAAQVRRRNCGKAGVNSPFGTITSNPAILTVRVPPAITIDPKSTNVTDDSITLTVTAGGTAPMAYQWQYNDQNIAETTANTLAIRGIKTNQ